VSALLSTPTSGGPRSGALEDGWRRRVAVERGFSLHADTAMHGAVR